MSEPSPPLHDFIYLDYARLRSLAAQLGISAAPAADAVERERLLLEVEPALVARGIQLDAGFDFNARWTRDGFSDGQFVRASGTVRLMDFSWIAAALGGLPAVLKKMSKLEMEALRNSEEGKRMSKSALQQRSQENQLAIARVEEMKADELGAVVSRLYGDIVRVKVRPRPAEQPHCALIGSAYAAYFYDSPAVLSQKYGIDIDAGWTVLGQLNIPSAAPQSMPIPTGNRMEDSFEQIALLMNNAFHLSSAAAFPALSFTPIAIYRRTR